VGRRISLTEYTGPGVAWVDRPMSREISLSPELQQKQNEALERISELKQRRRALPAIVIEPVIDSNISEVE
jgi:hypothetical protein